MDFILKASAQEIASVVVTGMQKMDKRIFTGATDQLLASDVKLDGISEISRGQFYRSDVAGAGCWVGRDEYQFPGGYKPENQVKRDEYDAGEYIAVVGGGRCDHGGCDQRRCQFLVVGRRYDAHQFGHRRTQRR